MHDKIELFSTGNSSACFKCNHTTINMSRTKCKFSYNASVGEENRLTQVCNNYWHYTSGKKNCENLGDQLEFDAFFNQMGIISL
jgi:hypothetical protein